MTNNTASISGLGELVLGDVIWLAAQKLVDSDMSGKARQLLVYSIIRQFIVFIVKVMLWHSVCIRNQHIAAFRNKYKRLKWV